METASVALRSPHWAFGPLALALLYAIGLSVIVVLLGKLVGDPVLLDLNTANGLALPAAAATVVSAGMIGPRLRRGRIVRLRDPILLVVVSWALVGALWPFSSFVSQFVAGGPVERQMLLALARASLSVPMIIGTVLGALGGLVAGAAAMLVCLQKS